MWDFSIVAKMRGWLNPSKCLKFCVVNPFPKVYQKLKNRNISKCKEHSFLHQLLRDSTLINIHLRHHERTHAWMYQNLSNLISVLDPLLPSILNDPINYITSYTTGSFLHEIHINTFFSFIACMWSKVVKLKIKRHKPLVRLSWRCNIFSFKFDSSPWKPLVWDEIALVVFMFVFSHHLTLF